MATKEVLQAGRRVIVDNKGNKTYAPFSSGDDDSRPTSRTLGDGAAANAAQSLIDARARREADAGFKRGGKVVAKKPAPAKKSPTKRR